MTIAELHTIFTTTTGASTDTRKISTNSMFFALKGASFNGNTFASKAIEAGAAFAVVDEEKYATSSQHILVPDVLETLQKLATYHREKHQAIVISLTGSNGKTTTKELIAAVLANTYKTIATTGNLNNHIGVPLTLLRITKETEIAVVEMGANHQKEIAFLCSIALPDYGYITNFGKAHLEGFGGIEGVIKGKSELYDFLKAHNKHIFYNAEDPIQLKKLSDYSNKSSYSTAPQATVSASLVESTPFIKIKHNTTTINTQLIGSYNFTNCCAALLIGTHFTVPEAEIHAALTQYAPTNNRSQVLKKGSCTILLDAYNANPSSMTAALDNLERTEASKKIVFLGDMFELGDTAATEHQFIAELALTKNIDHVYLIGENFNRTNSAATVFKTFTSCADTLKAIEFSNSTILIKGSRGMALERLLNILICV